MKKADALKIAQRICSGQEKCKYDIIKNLRKWKVDENDIEDILLALEKERFINEQRYAEAFVKDKFKFNSWGRIKIRYQLKMKNIPEKAIQNALEEINDEEYQTTLEEILRKKQVQLKNDSLLQKKSKLVRFANSRGFENDYIFSLIDKIIEK